MKKRDSSNGRFYERKDDVFYPSSTTILSVLPMSYWFKEYLQTHTKEEADKLLRAAGFQGSKIHHTIELILKGEVISPSGITEEQLTKTQLISDEDYGDVELLDYLKKPYTEKEDKMMKGFLNWFNEYKPETLESEKIVFSDRHKYAGTVDWVGYITKKKMNKKTEEIVENKEVCIIDWKTGKGLYESYDMQVASYVNAYCEMHKKDRKVKKPKKAYLLQLGVNKIGYKFQEIKDIKKAFKDFLHYQKTWIMNNPDATPKEPYQFLSEYKI